MEKTGIVQESSVYRILSNADNPDREVLEEILLKHLSEENRSDYEAVIKGKKLPSFMSDVVAKKLFDADEHRERLQSLFRDLSGDDTIIVDSSFRNEGFIQAVGSKKTIFDITSHFHDGRLGDAEFQLMAQNFTLERGDIYGSDLLLLQYSVNYGDKKSEVNYKNVKGVLIIYLMKNSPEPFRSHESDRYIHRFKVQRSESGIEYTPLIQKVYVQLDKCLKQFLDGKDGENNAKLQLLLSLLADSSNAKVVSEAHKYQELWDMIVEAKTFVQNKEVQAMLLAEKYAEADFNAVISFERQESEAIGEARGEARGEIKTLVSLVCDGLLDQSVAAKRCNKTEAEFAEMVKNFKK